MTLYIFFLLLFQNKMDDQEREGMDDLDYLKNLKFAIQIYTMKNKAIVNDNLSYLLNYFQGKYKKI